MESGGQGYLWQDRQERARAMVNLHDSIKALLETTRPEQCPDVEVRCAAWRRLGLLPASARGTVETFIQEALIREIHPRPLNAIRDYLLMSGDNARERETARQVLRQRLRKNPLPPPIQKALLDTLLSLSCTLPVESHRETVLDMIQSPFIIHPQLCVELGEELLSTVEIRPGSEKYLDGDPRPGVALKDLAAKLGPRHPSYPYFHAQSIRLECTALQSGGKTLPTGRREISFPLDLERYLLSGASHFRGDLLQSIAVISGKSEAHIQNTGGGKLSPEKCIFNSGQPTKQVFLDELERELHGIRDGSARAAGYGLLAEADQYRDTPRFQMIIRELVRSGPGDWKGFRLELEEYIAQTPWQSPGMWEETGKIIWKFMHQNGETEIYTPLVQALTMRLTPMQMARVVTSYPAASPMPEPMVRSIRRHLASDLTTRAGMMGRTIGVDWKTLPAGQSRQLIPPSLEWVYGQWQKHIQQGRLPESIEIDHFVEACGKNHEKAAEFFMERLSVRQEASSIQRALNWRVTGAIIRRWKPEAMATLAQMALSESRNEPDALVLATCLAQGRGARYALRAISPEQEARWAALYAEELIGQWYQSSPPTKENRAPRWVRFHEMHWLRKELQDIQTARAQAWKQRLQIIMEETFHGSDWRESQLAADCFRQNGEKPQPGTEIHTQQGTRHTKLSPPQQIGSGGGMSDNQTGNHPMSGQYPGRDMQPDNTLSRPRPGLTFFR